MIYENGTPSTQVMIDQFNPKDYSIDDSEPTTEGMNPSPVPFSFNFSLFDKLVNSRNWISKSKLIFKDSVSSNLDFEVPSNDCSLEPADF